jgi:hypothetical protein
MAKNTNLSGFTTAQTKPETTMDKTTRAVKQIKDAETRHREDKMARLRKARHESEA